MLIERYKVQTTIDRLMIGDFFIPEGDTEVYDFVGYDDEWGLWCASNVKTGRCVYMDAFACTWLPWYDPKTHKDH